MIRKPPLQVPGRHIFILPSPKNKTKESTLWDDKKPAEPPIAGLSSQQPSFVAAAATMKSLPVVRQERVIAYIAHAPLCQHSDALLQLADEVNVAVQVYDVMRVDPPDWLPGTPSIETESGNISYTTKS